METIGARVRALREQRGLKAVDLARAIGIKQPSLFDIEHGRTRTLRGNTLTRLCEELHTTANFLLYGRTSTSGLDLAIMEAELTHAIRALTPERRVALIEYARFLMAQQPALPAPRSSTASPPPAASIRPIRRPPRA